MVFFSFTVAFTNKINFLPFVSYYSLLIFKFPIHFFIMESKKPYNYFASNLLTSV